jgi:hypothetical protein
MTVKAIRRKKKKLNEDINCIKQEKYRLTSEHFATTRSGNPIQDHQFITNRRHILKIYIRKISYQKVFSIWLRSPALRCWLPFSLILTIPYVSITPRITRTYCCRYGWNRYVRSDMSLATSCSWYRVHTIILPHSWSCNEIGISRSLRRNPVTNKDNYYSIDEIPPADELTCLYRWNSGITRELIPL